MTDGTPETGARTERFLCAYGCCNIGVAADFNPYTDLHVGLRLQHFRPGQLVKAAPELVSALADCLTQLETIDRLIDPGTVLVNPDAPVRIAIRNARAVLKKVDARCLRHHAADHAQTAPCSAPRTRSWGR